MIYIYVLLAILAKQIGCKSNSMLSNNENKFMILIHWYMAKYEFSVLLLLTKQGKTMYNFFEH